MSMDRKGNEIFLPRHISKGFTLVEVILSLFIFSIIASGTIAATRVGLNAGTQMEEIGGQLRQLQTMRALLKEDLAQIVPRLTRDEFGAPLIAPFSGGVIANNNNFDEEEGRYLLRFVRGGWDNPGYVEPRSELQFVEYVALGDQLIRRSRPFLDAAEDFDGQEIILERIMMDNLQSLDVQFVSNFTRGEPVWMESWPFNEGVNGELAPPLAIELLINSTLYGEINQRFWIGRMVVE